MIDLDRLEALLGAATEGPWCFDNRGDKCDDIQLGIACLADETPIAGYFENEDAIYVEQVAETLTHHADAELICALRNAAPEILAELRAARERIAELERAARLAAQRMFPIIVRDTPGCPRSVPWSLIAHHEERAQDNHQQSLSRLAKRGGLSPCEFLAVVENRPWHRMPPEESTAQLNALVAKHNSTTRLVGESRVMLEATPSDVGAPLRGLDSPTDLPAKSEQKESLSDE